MSQKLKTRWGLTLLSYKWFLFVKTCNKTLAKDTLKMSMRTSPFLVFFSECVFYAYMYQYIKCLVFLLRATVGHVGLLALQVPLKDKCSRKQGSWCLLVSRIWWIAHGPTAHTVAVGPGWPTLMIMWFTTDCKLLQHTLILQWWVGYLKNYIFLH